MVLSKVVAQIYLIKFATVFKGFEALKYCNLCNITKGYQSTTDETTYKPFQTFDNHKTSFVMLGNICKCLVMLGNGKTNICKYCAMFQTILKCLEAVVKLCESCLHADT